MHKRASLTLAAGLLAVHNEAESVRNERDRLLGIRGLIEMLFLQGLSAHHLLCCGRYHVSLKSVQVPGKEELAITSAAELSDIVDALDMQLRALVSALNEFDSFGVALTASPVAVDLLGSELDDHYRRVGAVRKQVEEWRKALSAKA